MEKASSRSQDEMDKKLLVDKLSLRKVYVYRHPLDRELRRRAPNLTNTESHDPSRTCTRELPSSVKYLKLSRCVGKLTEVEARGLSPECLASLINLIHFDPIGTCISKYMGKLTKLEVIDLSDTCISELPEFLANLIKKFLDVRSTSIRHIRTLEELGKIWSSFDSKLEVIDLSDTCISELPEFLANLIKKFLDVRSTSISHIRTLEELGKIWSSFGSSDIASQSTRHLPQLRLTGGGEIRQSPREIINCALLRQPSHVAIDILEHNDHHDHAQVISCSELTYGGANLALETFSAYLDQMASPRRPRYALIAMLVSFVALLVGLVDIVPNIRGINGRRMNSSSVITNFGLVCAVMQCATSVVQYVCFRRHHDNPIKLSFFPIAFVLYVLFVTVTKRRR